MIFTLISCSIHLQQTCFDMPRSQQSWKIFTDSSLLLTADISSPNIEHNVGSCCLVQYKKKQGFDHISSTLTTRSYPSLMHKHPQLCSSPMGIHGGPLFLCTSITSKVQIYMFSCMYLKLFQNITCPCYVFMFFINPLAYKPSISLLSS